MDSLTNQLGDIQIEIQFSGSIFVKKGESVHFHTSFGYANRDNEIYKYHVMGYDPRVSFHAGYYP